MRKIRFHLVAHMEFFKNIEGNGRLVYSFTCKVAWISANRTKERAIFRSADTYNLKGYSIIGNNNTEWPKTFEISDQWLDMTGLTKKQWQWQIQHLQGAIFDTRDFLLEWWKNINWSTKRQWQRQWGYISRHLGNTFKDRCWRLVTLNKKHLFVMMSWQDLTNNKTMTKTKTMTNTILGICNFWDNNYNSDNWGPEFMTIIVIVTLDSIPAKFAWDLGDAMTGDLVGFFCNSAAASFHLLCRPGKDMPDQIFSGGMEWFGNH